MPSAGSERRPCCTPQGRVRPARMTPAAVEEKVWALAPVNYPDLAAMVGETSDNLPGVPASWPKTAAKWIATYGTLDGLVAAAADIPGKAVRALREHLDDVIRNRKINALVCDLDLPAGPTELASRPTGTATPSIRCSTRSNSRAAHPPVRLSRRGAEAAAPQRRSPAWRSNRSRRSRPWLEAHGTGLVGSGFGRGTCRRPSCDGVAFAAATAPGMGGGRAVLDDPVFADVLVDDDAKVSTMPRGSCMRLGAHGWSVRGIVADTALGTYLVKPDQRPMNLPTSRCVISKRETGHRSTTRPDSELSRRRLRRHRTTRQGDARPWEVLEAELVDRRVTLLREVEIPLIDVLLGMETWYRRRQAST